MPAVACCPFMLTGAPWQRALLLGIAMVCAGHGNAGAATLPATGPNVLVILETVDATSAGLASNIEVRLGRPVAVGGGPGLAMGMPAMHRSAASLGFEGVPAWDYGTASYDAATIEAMAAARLRNAAPALERQLDVAMQAAGADVAVFTLSQKVEPLAGGAPGSSVRQAAYGANAARMPAATLAWTHVRFSGQARHFSAPRVRPDAPVFLSVRYTPLRIASDLPAGVAYQDAGVLAWGPADSALQPIGPMERIQTGGAFDEPVAAPGLALDPDAVLRCLVDHRGLGCDPALPDVRSLLAREGASLAVLEYRRRLSAMRHPVRLADGTTAWEIMLSTDVRRRTLGAPAFRCGTSVQYRNIGTRGYSVITTSDRYLVTAGALTPFRPIGSFSDALVVQSEPYDKQVAVGASTIANLDPLVIDPVGEMLDLVPAASLPGLSRVAPIEASSCGRRRP